MSGATGKMTAEAISQRGPRMVLGILRGFLVIFRERQEPFVTREGVRLIPATIARSYSLRYLLGIARAFVKDVQP